MATPLSAPIDAAKACWYKTVHRGPERNPEQLGNTVATLRRVGLDRSATQLEAARSPQDWLRLAAWLETAGALLRGPTANL